MSHPLSQSEPVSPVVESPTAQSPETGKLPCTLPWKHLFVIISTVLITLLFAEMLARLYSTLSQPLQGHSNNFDQKYALSLKPPPEIKKKPFIAILGDSLVDRDVSPELLTKRLSQNNIPLETLNLGVRAGNLSQSLFLLKTITHTKWKPSVVVIGLNKRSLRTGHPQDLIEEQAAKDSYLGKCYIYPPETLMGRLDCFASDYSYLYRHRRNLKETLVDLSGSLTKTTTKILKKEPLTMSPMGWSPRFGTMDLQKTLKIVEAMKQAGEIKHGGHYSEESLVEVLDYCSTQDIPVILVWMPRSPLYLKTAIPEQVQEYQEMHRNILRFSQTHQLPYLNMEGTETDLSHFYDVGHMNIEGALSFTDQLAERLLQPPYRALLEKAVHQTPYRKWPK